MADFYDYRLKFSKNGPIRFVGHLDVMRYIQKANRRAGLPVRYSEGFSPHQILSFALPLSVGATSDGEYLDMSLLEKLPPDEIVGRLNEVMHEGIEARACVLLPERAPKAMTVIAAARYRLRLKVAGEHLIPVKSPAGAGSMHTEEKSMADALRDYLSQEHIPVVKTTKKKEQTLDLKPLVHAFEVAEDGTLTALLHAGSRDHVKPALLYEGFCHSLGLEFSPHLLQVHRLDLYESTPDGAGGVLFVPLIAEN